MRIAVAGGNGFIGSHIGRLLEAEGHTLDRFGRDQTNEIEAPCDALIWAAGSRAGQRAELSHVHVQAPLEAIARLRPSVVVYLSSGEVYGQVPVPFREGGATLPLTDYGRAKLRGEREIQAATRAAQTRSVALRLPVVYGPGQAPTMLIPSAARALLGGHSFDTTEGRQTRDFLHVRDVAEAVRLSLLRDAHGVFNLGSGAETRVRDLLLQLAEAVSPEARDLLKFGAKQPRAGEALRYHLDATTARTALGWSPQISLRQGLSELVEALRTDPAKTN